MTEAILENVRFSNIQMQGINLSRANLDGANLDGADLSGANLKGASLINATLKFSAKLNGADLSGANLTNASLWRTEIGSAKLDGVIWKGTVISSQGLSLSMITSLLNAGSAIFSEKDNKTEAIAQSDRIKVKINSERKNHTPLIQINRNGLSYSYSLNAKAMYITGLRIIDLDGDKEPEILLDIFSGGAHCCSYSTIYKYDPLQDIYTTFIHNWRDTGYRLSDLNGNGSLEFVSRDMRFAYHFSSFAASRFPSRIWEFRQGKLLDVTKSFPQPVKEQADELWYEYTLRYGGLIGWQGGVNTRNAIALLAAYMANQYLLNQEQNGWHQVQESLQISDFSFGFSWIQNFLRSTGYAPNSALNKYLIRVLDRYSGLEGLANHKVTLSFDGQKLFSVSDDNGIFGITGLNILQIWDITTGKLLRSLALDGQLIVVNPDSNTLLINKNGEYQFWEFQTNQVKTLKKISTSVFGSRQELSNLFFNTSGQLLSINWEQKHRKKDIQVNILNVSTDNPVRTFIWNSVQKGELKAVSADGYLAASIDEDFKIKLWEVSSERLLHMLSGHLDSIVSVQISSNNTVLVTDSKDDTIKVWDIKTGKLIATIPNGEHESVSIHISGNGKTIAISDRSGVIKLWNVSL
jgi:hypothetical protein